MCNCFVLMGRGMWKERCTEHVARMWEVRNAHIFRGRQNSLKLYSEGARRCVNKIQLNLETTICDYWRWTELDSARINMQWRVLILVPFNILLHYISLVV
jgi:hypothetical protein